MPSERLGALVVDVVVGQGELPHRRPLRQTGKIEEKGGESESAIDHQLKFYDNMRSDATNTTERCGVELTFLYYFQIRTDHHMNGTNSMMSMNSMRNRWSTYHGVLMDSLRHGLGARRPDGIAPQVHDL